MFVSKVCAEFQMGMNCHVPAQDGDSEAPFLWIFGYMSLQSIVLGVLFYYKQWF